MKHYLLSVITPEGVGQPPPEILEPIMRKVDTVNQELKAAGAWVFAGGLNHPSTATVVRLQDGEVLTTDGTCRRGSHRGRHRSAWPRWGTRSPRHPAPGV